MSVAILYITDRGHTLAKRLTGLYPEARIVKFSSGTVPTLWKESKSLIFIMATGIVVRTIAPLLQGKHVDPAVVVLDEKGMFAVSLLSGHLGGANELAKEIANFLGSEAVITTASDVNTMPSIDLWARDNDLTIEDWGLVPQIGTRCINNGTLRVYTNVGIELPDEFLKVSDPRFADLFITNKRDVYSTSAVRVSGESTQCSAGACRVKGQLYLRPKNLILGIGCNSNTPADEIEQAARRTLDAYNLSFASVHSIATIDIKGNEPGLKAFAKKHTLGIVTFTPDELNRVEGIAKSEAALKATGAHAVAEPAAFLSSGSNVLLVSKQKIGNVTIAVAEKRFGGQKEEKKVSVKEKNSAAEKMGASGKIYIVGTGPGSIEHITPHAQDAIRRSDIIVGYGTYIDLIGELIKGKEVFSTGMTKETDRCRKAVELALEGKTVSVISGGDPGIYAMAGLVFELIKTRDELSVMSNELEDSALSSDASRITPRASRSLSVEVIPGISALNACAARLGAPLMHDFASISLSDRLTPWDLIEKRLEAAAMADFVIALYNPKSKGRTEHIGRAREIIAKHRAPGTPVGIVKGAMREDEKIVITDLKAMLDHDIDMQTTVIIGNSKTFLWNNLIITPRGYENKKQ